MRLALVLLAIGGAGCATVEPGPRGLYFDLRHGLQHDVLLPGLHWTGFGRIDDFDVTYSTGNEEVRRPPKGCRST